MRKLPALMLAVAMCFLLIACGGETAEETATAAGKVVSQEEAEPILEEEPAEKTTGEEAASEEPDSEEPAEDAVCCELTVSVNPEFKLSLNKNGHVLALECLNEDAQNALENSDVIGMAADEAMVALLEDIYQYDSSLFPEEQPQIKITVVMYQEFTPIIWAVARMDEAVCGFAEEKQIPIAYMRGSAPASQEISNSISDTMDENGNRVIVEIDGDGVEWKMVCQGESTQVIELIRTDPDGTVTHCDMATNITTVTKPDGTTSQMEGVIGKG